jgi:hypothetical protein
MLDGPSAAFLAAIRLDAARLRLASSASTPETIEHASAERARLLARHERKLRLRAERRDTGRALRRAVRSLLRFACSPEALRLASLGLTSIVLVERSPGSDGFAFEMQLGSGACLVALPDAAPPYRGIRFHARSVRGLTRHVISMTARRALAETVSSGAAWATISRAVRALVDERKPRDSHRGRS